MTKDEVLKLALEALDDRSSLMKWQAAREALRQALAQPEQEPQMVGRITDNIKDMVLRQEVMLYTDEYLPIGTPVYTTPPQRTWVGLTDEEMQDLWDRYAHMEMMRAIEAKLKEKNNG